jgi:hypothetical protein
MESLAQVANLGSDILFPAFRKRDQVNGDQGKRVLAKRAINIDDAMRRKLENPSGPHPTEFFFTARADGDLNRKSFRTSNANTRAQTCPHHWFRHGILW